MKDHENFRYSKIISYRKKATVYSWFLIDKNREGVNFHGSVSDNEASFSNQYGFMTYGIESHRHKMTYEGQTPVLGCYVTGGNCYTDGSSLCASERLGHINPVRDDDEVWHVLHSFYRSWFEDKGEEK
jgi:hypothetical protein